MRIEYILNNLTNNDNHVSLWRSKLILDDNKKGYQVIVQHLKCDFPDNSNTKPTFIQKANDVVIVNHSSLVHIFDCGIITKQFYT